MKAAKPSAKARVGKRRAPELKANAASSEEEKEELQAVKMKPKDNANADR